MSLRILATLTTLLLLGGTAAAQDAPAEGATPAEGAAPAEGEAAADPMAEPDPMAGGELGGEATGEELPAEEAPADGVNKPISVGLLLGYGISLESGPNAWGLGFGVGGGYTLDMGLYLGARFVYYLGGSDTIAGVDFDTSVWEFGIEGGYDIDMNKLHIRPGLGLGLAGMSVTVPTGFGLGTVSGSSTEFYIAPGAAFLYDVSDSFFIGGEARLQVILASGGSAKGIILLANGGMRF